MILIGVILLVNFFAYTFASDSIEATILERVEEEASLIMNTLDYATRPLIQAGDTEAVQELFDQISNFKIIDRVFIIDDSQTIAYSTDRDEIGHLEHHVELDLLSDLDHLEVELFKHETSEYCVAIDYSEQGTFGHMSAAAPSALILVVDLGYMASIGWEIRSGFILSTLISNMAVIMTVTFMLYIKVSKPLHKLCDAADAIAERKYNTEVSIKGHLELDHLATAFNRMVKDIRENTYELQQAKEQAEAATAAKTVFLANMSHEIRTPLNTIIGFTDLMEEDETDSNKKQTLGLVGRAGKHLHAMLNDILDLSKIEMDSLELENVTVHPAEFFSDLNQFFRQSAEEKAVTLNISIDPETPYALHGDIYRMRQVYSNIISNGIKFTEKGSVSVEVRYNNGHLITHIKDTGIGIPREKLDEVFNAFAQSDMSTTRIYGGTGLGLTISKKLVEQMNGTISVNSALGEGSVFTIELPLEIDLTALSQGEIMVQRWVSYDMDVADITLEVIETLPERMEKIERAYAVDDIDQLEFEVHALKSITGNFGILEMFDILTTLEQKLLKKYNDHFSLLKDQRSILDHIKELESVIELIPERYMSYRQSEIVELKMKDSESKFTVLLAEDMPENRTLILRILKKMDVVIHEAEDGIEAFNKLKVRKYDLLLLDMHMPHLDGLGVLTKIHENTCIRPETILALTASVRKEEQELYIDSGCDGFVSKPVDKSELRNKIVSLIRA